MGKRANQGASTAAKKIKVDPALRVVIDTVKKAGHLPGQCSTMLASMLPFSLGVASDERAESQQKVVDMVEETLSTLKSEIETTVATEGGKLAEGKSKMAELVGAVKESETAFDAQKEAAQALNTTLVDANDAAGASLTLLADKKLAHTTCNASLVSLQEETTALTEAFQAHFQTPMEAGSGPNYKELKPFLQTMDLEASLYSTLPGTCAKSKEDRGSFDVVILEQLEKAISVKMSTLSESVSSQTLAAAECEAAVTAADYEHNSKIEVQNQATLAYTAAHQEQSDREAVLIKANEAVNEFQVALQEAMEACEQAKAKLVEFESGPLTNFTTYKTKTACAEAATAGA